MPMNRLYIRELFDDYFRVVSGVRRLVERPDEILLYKNTLDACTSTEYIPVLCDIIHGHLHWRISGYSSTRSNIAAAAVSTVSMVKEAMHKGGELLTSGLERTVIAYSQFRSGQSKRHLTSESFIALESDMPEFPQSPVSLASEPYRAGSPQSSVYRQHASPQSISSFIPPAHLPLPLSPLNIRPSSSVSTMASDVTATSTAVSTSSRYGHAGVPTSSQKSSASPLSQFGEDFEVVHESEWSPFDATTHTDPRIILFNEIIKYVYHTDPPVFSNHIMTIGLWKLLTMPDQSGIGTFVYTNLFLPHEMLQYIEEKLASRPTPRFKPSYSSPSTASGHKPL